MIVVNWLLAALALPVLGAALYLLLLTSLWRRPATRARARTLPSFVILVPAHNEERGIAATVRTLNALDYPGERRRVVVVADNCSDRTAEVAATEGAEVLVRQDMRFRGKGYALEFGIGSLLASAGTCAWDALAVVDADTSVSPNLLHAFAASLEAGAEAVQAAYLPRPGGAGPVSVITEVALTAFHVVRSGARERLGLSCGLRGNGMAFRRELLARVPHAAFSRTEDLEFGVHLGLRGVRVAFAGDAEVRGDMPERRAAVAIQRTRWYGGRAGVARQYLPALAGEALRRRSLMLADLACDLVVPPLSALVVASAAGLAASAALAAATGRPSAALVLYAATSAALGTHVLQAAILSGRTIALLKRVWAIPGYALDKFMLTLRSLRPVQDERWVRTLREGEDS